MEQVSQKTGLWTWGKLWMTDQGLFKNKPGTD